MIKMFQFERIIKELRRINPFFRKVLNKFYRSFFYNERKGLEKYLTIHNSKKLVALNIGLFAYPFEHVKDLFWKLQEDEELCPFLVTTTKWPPRTGKKETFDFLSKRYDLVYGQNLFSSPWLKPSPIKLFLELGVSSYHCEIQCFKILYTHGMAGVSFSKNMREVRFVNRYSALFLNGPIHKKAMLVAQKKYGGEIPPMYEIGYLKGDMLLRKASAFDRKNFLEKLELPSRPTVLYTPTWGDFSSPMEWLERVIEVCGEIGANLIVKLHPIMLTSKGRWDTGGIDWKNKLVEIQQRSNRTKILFDPDIDEVMLVADVMITEVSGMALEFMTLEKPVVFLPADRYFELFGEDRPEKWCRPEKEIKTKEDLRKELIKALDGRGFKYPVDELVYNRGKALDVMLKYIRKFVD